MEDYRNSSFLAQEVGPSFDFMLLDGPPSSTVSGPGTVASSFPGDNPFPSFDFADGAGKDFHGDHSFSGHRSHMSPASKNALRWPVSMQSGTVQRQEFNEHNLICQDNQHPYSRLGNRDARAVSQITAMEGPFPGLLAAGNMPVPYTLSGKAQSMQIGIDNPGTLHMAPPSAGTHVHGGRNEAATVQQYPSDSHITSSKFSNFLPMNVSVPEQRLNASNISGAGNLNHQNQFHRYASQYRAGNEELHGSYPTNQVPNGCGTPIPPEARLEAPARGFGLTEMQLLRQQALHLKQQQDLQLKQHQIMRLQQQQAALRQHQKVQSEAVLIAQKQEILRVQQQQEAMRLQRQEIMQPQQQEAFRMQRQAMYLKQQGTARTEESNSGLWSQEQGEMLSNQQDTVSRLQQQQTLWPQQPNSTWRRQEAGQTKNFHTQQEWAWSGHHQHQQTNHQKVTSPNQHQGLQFQQVQALQRQQEHIFPDQQQLVGSQQQHPMRFQQQALQTNQEPVIQSLQKHFSSGQHLVLLSGQELIESSQQAISQETCADFQGTSYSALLHGPDTPPYHTQSGGDTSFSDLAGKTGAFPSANCHTDVWPTRGSSSLQGLPIESLRSQHSASFQNLPLQNLSCGDHNFVEADGDGRQNTQKEYPVFGARALSPVKPPFERNKSVSADSEAGHLVSVRNFVSDARNEDQEHAKPLQASNHMSCQSLQLNGLPNRSNDTNLLSQSQQHFQVLQLSQQRSWECLVQKHGVSKPSIPEVCLPLSQSISRIDRSTALENGLQQNLGNAGTARISHGHNLQQIGGTSSDIADCYKQQQIVTTAIGSVSIDSSDEEDSLSLVKPLSWHDVGYRPNCDSNASNFSGQNRALQQVAPMLGRVDAIGSSGAVSQALPTMNQATLLNIQIPPENMRAMNDLSDEETADLRENEASGQTPSCLLDLDSSKDFWNRGPTIQDSVHGCESTSKPLNGHIDGYTRKHVYQVHKASSDFQVNLQDSKGQPMLEKWLMGDRGALQQVHNSFGVGGQPIVNAVETLSQDTPTSDNKVMQCCHVDTSIRHQGSSSYKLGISELPIDPSCSGSISLAHLRQSQPSSPQSPQQVKLGLGPANLCQVIKQVGIASAPASPQKHHSLLKNHGPSNAEGNSFFTGLSQGGSGPESPAGNRGDLSQGIIAVNDMVLPNIARPSPALFNSSSLHRERVDADTLQSPMGTTQCVAGGGFCQGPTSLSKGHHHDLATIDGNLEEDSSITFQANLKSCAVSSEPLYNTGNIQERFSTGLQNMKMNGRSLHGVQNQQTFNIVLKQLGSKVQPASLEGLLSTLKTSLAEHSKDSGDCEKSLEESGPFPIRSPISARNVSLSMQNPYLTSKKAVNQGHVNDDISSCLKAASFSDLNQSFKQDKVIESSTLCLLSDQGQSSQFLSANGIKSDALQSGEQGDRLSVMKNSNPTSLQVEMQSRDLDTQPESSCEDQYLREQKLSTDNFSHHQVLLPSTVDTVQTAKMTNAAGFMDKLRGGRLKHFKSSLIHGCLGMMALGQVYDTCAENMRNRSAMELETPHQEKPSASNLENQSGQQLVDPSSSITAQQQQQLATDSVIASSLPSTMKVCSAGVVNDVRLSCSIESPLDATNHQASYSQKLKQENFSGHDKPESCSTNFLSSKSSQLAAHMNHSSNRHVNTDDVKAEVAGVGGHGHFATLDRIAPCQGSSSKTSLLGPSPIHPKKRKKQNPLLIPWYIAATQPRDSLPSTSEMELVWANTANRFSDKDDGDCHKGSVSSGMKARRRLRLTSQLMQQLIPPPSTDLIHRNTPVDVDCTTYSLAKFAIEDACRLVTNTRREATASNDCSDNKNLPLHVQEGRSWGNVKSIAATRCVENFMEKARGLEGELARMETSSSVSDLRRDIGDTEKMAIVNRLAKYHGASFTADSTELRSIQNISDCNSGNWKPSIKKYVTMAPMPRTLPGVKCLSL